MCESVSAAVSASAYEFAAAEVSCDSGADSDSVITRRGDRQALSREQNAIAFSTNRVAVLDKKAAFVAEPMSAFVERISAERLGASQSHPPIQTDGLAKDLGGDMLMNNVLDAAVSAVDEPGLRLGHRQDIEQSKLSLLAVGQDSSVLYDACPLKRRTASSLFQALDSDKISDRWDAVSGQTELLPVCADGSVTWQQQQRAGVGQHERLGPPIKQAYIQGFLRENISEIGERACCAGSECQGVRMYIRSHFHKDNDGAGFVLREFLTPEQSDAYAKCHELPAQIGLCVVCIRYSISRWVKQRNMAGTGNFTGMLCPHSVIVNAPGEYEASRCLYSRSPVTGLDRMMPEHADNRYVYTRDERGNRILEELGLCTSAVSQNATGRLN